MRIDTFSRAESRYTPIVRTALGRLQAYSFAAASLCASVTTSLSIFSHRGSRFSTCSRASDLSMPS